MVRLLPLFVAVPLGAAFILPLFERLKKARWLADLVAVVVTIFLFIFALQAMLAPEAIYWMGKWSPESIIGINLVLDGLSSLMLLTVNLVALCATIFSVEYMKRFTSKPLYYSLFLLMVAGMNGVILSGDMFNLYVFLEIAAIASYALVAFGVESEELEASFKYLILGGLASTFILFGIGILYNATGTLNMAQIAQRLGPPGQNKAVLLAICFFLMGFGLKGAMVPFHAWLPDAHPSAPAPISAMLSGVLIKALGIYALIRVLFNVVGVTEFVANALLIGGIASMTIGGLLAIGQWDFKRLLAYSSISQIGYILLGLGIAAGVLSRPEMPQAIAALALFGSLYHLLNHAVFKGLLFLSSGAVEYATGTRNMREIGGLRHKMPVTAGACRVGIFSIAGIPPFNGFFSKVIIILAAVLARYYTSAAVTTLISFVTLLYYIKVQRYILDGDVPEALKGVKEVPVLMQVSLIVLAVFCVALGLMAPFLREPIFQGAENVIIGGFDYVRLILAGG
jgi:multicomponent Na+:H+ antiporter subunit D